MYAARIRHRCSTKSPAPGVARPNLTHLSAHPVQEMRAHISKAFRDKKDMTDVAQVSKMVAYGR